jgi:mono/diheme cytochrome c family protein
MRAESKRKPAVRLPTTASGKETFLRYCASCHGNDNEGNGPTAFAMRKPLSDLTTLSRRHEVVGV